MKFTKMKRFIIVCIVTIGIVVIVFIVSTDSNKIPITEKNVRTQLEQMYDAEVAEVKKNDDVYEAIIAKSGQVYLVEMSATTGNVNSLEHTDEFIIEEVPVMTKTTNGQFDEGPEISQKSTMPSSQVEIVESNIVSSNGTTKLVIIEKPKASSPKVKIVENPNVVENKKSKKTGTKKEAKAEEKPIKQAIKDAFKEVLAAETSKPVESSKEESKKETKTEETTKTEVAKIDAVKAEVSKSETNKVELEKIEPPKTTTSKTEAAKTETTKSETTVKTESSKTEEQKNTEKSELSVVVKTEEKKTEVTEKPITVLITGDEALKIAQQQQKGTVENNSFVKTNEGGYYLIVMTATKTEESVKEKKTKATIQVHAISGKILSVTWE
ncbi:hypothetical protein [Psychrobacillus antarcticus]|uniref:hypothetical protein n=1 Tax=Psychrobacillus antarcticus TaxID=2879115 RepID=UPI002407CBB2|nr:hypothetical protein [Psychrobacillus antarcticus]